MKRWMIYPLCISMLLMLTACKRSAAPEQGASGQTATRTAAPAQSAVRTADPGAQGTEKTGVAITTSVGGSASASGEGDGKAQTDSTIATVTIDGDGVITSCAIDQAQTVIQFSATGKLTTAPDAAFHTKQELGAEYGMKKASGIGKEWNEQVDALADYVKGKTADEVRGITLTETTAASSEDLKTSCTISIGGFVEAIARAADNATAPNGGKGDRLGIGVKTEMGDSKDASDETPGLAQADSTFAVVSVNGDGVITSCIIDACQANVNFDAMGQIRGDVSAPVVTKNQMGGTYGMAAVSGIGKEWNEQAAAFAAHCVGKTVDEVKGIALDSSGVAADEDLRASVTIHVGDFIDVVEKAVANAK